ncbi:protein ABSCISIC ACID-INSENSITIVE 5-like [Apium graveolens]|uniref:protein ABSCISIC ACID-INSENSITIVE 5-like n=1 Tax=Apium graveolens TaxID=4045 RepID=UPI003D79C120
MLNNTGEGRFRQGSPASPVSFDSVGANQSDSVNNLMDVNAANRSSGPTTKVIYRKQRRTIKNRESAARSRARRQAYAHDLEARVHVLIEENIRLQQDMEEIKRRKQQYMEEVMKARKAKDGKKRLKRSWSSLC